MCINQRIKSSCIYYCDKYLHTYIIYSTYINTYIHTEYAHAGNVALRSQLFTPHSWEETRRPPARDRRRIQVGRWWNSKVRVKCHHSLIPLQNVSPPVVPRVVLLVDWHAAAAVQPAVCGGLRRGGLDLLQRAVSYLVLAHFIACMYVWLCVYVCMCV